MTTALIALQQRRIHNKSFAYIISKAIQHSLKELGIDAKIVSEEEGGKADIVFVVWSAGIKLDKFDYSYSIHITSEQLPFFEGAPTSVCEMWEQKSPEFRKYDYLFEHSSQQVDFLKNHGYNAIHFPWGYTPMLDTWQQHINSSQKEIPVSFIGGATERRQAIIKTIGDIFWKVKSTKLTESEVIARSQINLNIKNSHRGAFEAGRVICLLLGNKAFTISEPYEDDIPLVNGEHLIIAKAEDLPTTVKYYLAHPEERIKIAEQGYDFVKNHYTMTQNLERALKCISTHSK